MLNIERRYNKSMQPHKLEPVAKNSNIVLAVLLNLLSTGFGYFYLGLYWRGAILSFSILALSYYPDILISLPLDLIPGFVVTNPMVLNIDLTIQVIIFMISTIDIVLKFNIYDQNKNSQLNKSEKKSILKIFILSFVFPIAGLYYSGLRKTAIIMLFLFQAIMMTFLNIIWNYWAQFNWISKLHFQMYYFFSAHFLVILHGIIFSIISIIYINKNSKKADKINSTTVDSSRIEKPKIIYKKLGLIPASFLKQFFLVSKYFLMTAATAASLVIAFFFKASSINFDSSMFGIFINIILLKVFLRNIDIVKDETTKHKFDLSIIFNLIVLFLMGYKYAIILIFSEVLLTLLAKKYYFKSPILNMEFFSYLYKNILSITVTFGSLLLINPSQVYNLKMPQNLVVPITIYIICQLLLEYAPKKIFSSSSLSLSWLIYSLSVLVFSVLFYTAVFYGYFAGIYLVIFSLLMIQFLIEIQQDYYINKLKMLEMEVSIFKDVLTEAFNKRYLTNVLEELNTSNLKYSIIMMDIDNFKNINDTYGHQTGDLALKHLVHIINVCIRKESDAICRYGGEEFIVVLKNTDKIIAANLAERIRKQLEQTPFISPVQKILKFTASFGVAGIEENEDIIKVADERLYEAKHSGKNKVVSEGIA